MPELAQGDLFQPSRGDVPALIKTLHDLAGEEGTRQGRAPLAAVMGLEALLAIPTQYRDGRLHELAITRKAIYRDWGCCDPRNFNHREAKRQDKALARISQLTVAAGRGWYKPLMVQAIEGPKLNDRVLFVVRLPHEAQQGPAIPRPLLRKVVQSRLAWLGLANLCIPLRPLRGHQGAFDCCDTPRSRARRTRAGYSTTKAKSCGIQTASP